MLSVLLWPQPENNKTFRALTRGGREPIRFADREPVRVRDGAASRRQGSAGDQMTCLYVALVAFVYTLLMVVVGKVLSMTGVKEDE